MPSDPVSAVVAGEPTLTARSVVASTLLGIDPPELPARLLVRSGELFGIAEGTTRVAISRMTSSGELTAADGAYRLTGSRLVARQSRQTLSRAGERTEWDGTWTMAVIIGGDRVAADRVSLRRSATSLRLAERREGLWLRPNNLPDAHAATQPDALGIVEAQCERYTATPDDDPGALARELWDLAAWRTRAICLLAAIAALVEPLQASVASTTDQKIGSPAGPASRHGSAESVPKLLGAAFVVSAATLRHFQLDPLLPDELLGPDWPGGVLRTDFEVLDRAFKAGWAAHFTSGS